MDTTSDHLVNPPIKTLIVDDAPLMRKIIHQILSGNDHIEIVGTATNGLECLEKIHELRPDVITLDIDMPVMNGITTVKNIMVRHQIPIVIISSLVQDGYFAFEALRLGVMDFIPKPSRIAASNWGDEEELVRMRVAMATSMQIHRIQRVRRRKRAGNVQGPQSTIPSAVVVIGTTLAGPNTIMHIVTQLSQDFQGAIIALQEIHPRILGPFCQCLNEISPLEVVPVLEACPLRPGKVYMASTFKGLRIDRLTDWSADFGLKPAECPEFPINQLFQSVAEHFGSNSCGVLLTGVGSDGADGMREIKRQGGFTIAQEQNCCVYPNLVEHAIREEVVDLVMSKQGIANRLESWIKGIGHIHPKISQTCGQELLEFNF